MSLLVIPVKATANQTASAVLDGLNAQIALMTTDFGLFADVTYDGARVATGRLCLDRTDINAAKYMGLPQPLFFADLQGTSDPVWTGFGTRYLLCYGTPPIAKTTPGLTLVVSSSGRLDIDFILDKSILE